MHTKRNVVEHACSKMGRAAASLSMSRNSTQQAQDSLTAYQLKKIKLQNSETI